MPYSEKELEDIERDPARLRAYFWHMARHWQRMARKNRKESRQMGELHPVTNYRPAFEEGYDKIRWAGILDDCAKCVLENIDTFVESTATR